MPEVVELREVTDRRDVVHRAVQRLSAGELVALPSEAGYVVAAAALTETAVGKLPGDGLSILLLRSALELPDFAPQMTPAGGRIARRCWPGPMTLRVPSSVSNGFVAALPAGTRDTLTSDGHLSLRVSSHPVLSEITHLMNGPLVIREVSLAKGPEATDPNLRDVSLLATEHTTSEVIATIVRTNSTGWTIERVGAVPESKLQVAACEVIVFVCTGNTCRSPMAEGLCRKMLADRLNCSESELTQRGFIVASAGLAADYGSAASYESIAAMRQRGIDLRSHSSQPLSERLLEQADRCYTMTKGHRNAILDSRPDLVNRVQLLSRDGRDVSDPIGSGPQEYAACASSIERQIAQILNEIVTPNVGSGS